MGAPSIYRQDVHDDWGWALAAKGKTDAEIASEFGVSKRTVDRWKWKTDASGKPVLDKNGEKVLSSFGMSLVTAKEIADAKAEHSLYLLCTGYDYVEEEKILEYEMDGSVKPVRVRTKKVHVKPDVMAIMYWLNNRSRKTGEWRQKQEVSLEGSIDIQEQDRRTRELLDRMTDEQLAQYESLCNSVAPTG